MEHVRRVLFWCVLPVVYDRILLYIIYKFGIVAPGHAELHPQIIILEDALACVEIKQCVRCYMWPRWLRRAVRNRHATPSSRRRVDGVEVDSTIQHERAVKFDFHTGRDQAARGDPVLLHGADAEDADGARDGAAGEGAEGGAGG